MKRMITLLFLFITLSTLASAQVRGQKVQKIKALIKVSVEKAPWQDAPALKIYKGADKEADIVIDPADRRQAIQGFGGCFNEKGWEALSLLSGKQREEVLARLFDPVRGAGFNICRVPIGASDYAIDRYTLNQTPNDFQMEFFSIDRDRRALIPYIKAAMKFKPDLKVWGSAWTPPTWMKKKDTFDGSSMKDDPKIYEAYALYLARFIEEYRREGVNLYAVAVQNEPAMRTNYPSCFWRADQMQAFIRDYMGPTFAKRNLRADIMLGTIQDGNFNAYPGRIMADKKTADYVSIIGYQWDGLKEVAETRTKFPDKLIMQTETDCGNWHWIPEVFNPDRPQNDWTYGSYTWKKIRTYFGVGVGSYMLWNMVLDEEGKSIDSKRPWPQNAAVVVDRATKTVRYTPMYYAFRHVASFVEEDAHYLSAGGNFTNRAVFINPNGEVVAVLENDTDESTALKINLGEYWMYAILPAHSWSTIRVPPLK